MLLWCETSSSEAGIVARAGHEVVLEIRTHPVEPGQTVRARYRVTGGDPNPSRPGGEVIRKAQWLENIGANSRWRLVLGPFKKGEHVEYAIEGGSANESAKPILGSFVVLPRLWVALLWHQHQPLYRDFSSTEEPTYLKPWVRLHALRDYYGMAAILADHPAVRVTINLTPVLLMQLEDYAERGATDRALQLTLKPANALSPAEREELLGSFFDADWHHQIFVHARYRELFEKRKAREHFDDQDLRDLQMWFNLAWFGSEFRERDVRLVTGELVSVRRFVDKARGFSESELQEMVAEQRKILRAVVPLHRALQDSGQIEVSTTPFYHPILPLLIDTDRATIDRPNTTFPKRFAHPEDADAHVRLAVELYQSTFGRAPRGMWPAEGAVAKFALSHIERHGIEWIASDQGVLARSGRWGYEAHSPDVLCRAYSAEAPDKLKLFFRATAPSDDIGFHFQAAPDQAAAAKAFVERLKREYGSGLGDDDRILTLALDGENAWGAYQEDGRPFLHALYRALAEDPEVQTTTFSAYLEHRQRVGASERIVYGLFTGSWIDEIGSAPGVDLGTWIGESEENRAWELLGAVRDTLFDGGEKAGTSALQALYAAEGSDWFWWFGEDQDSGSDQEFDDLFRIHLRNALRLADRAPLAELELHIVPHAVVWTFSQPLSSISAGDRLVFRTNCPGELEWWCGLDHGCEALNPVGGVMAGIHRYEHVLGSFPAGRELVFRFSCRHANCSGGPCCDATTQHVAIRGSLAKQVPGGSALAFSSA